MFCFISISCACSMATYFGACLSLFLFFSTIRFFIRLLTLIIMILQICLWLLGYTMLLIWQIYISELLVILQARCYILALICLKLFIVNIWLLAWSSNLSILRLFSCTTLITVFDTRHRINGLIKVLLLHRMIFNRLLLMIIKPLLSREYILRIASWNWLSLLVWQMRSGICMLGSFDGIVLYALHSNFLLGENTLRWS